MNDRYTTVEEYQKMLDNNCLIPIEEKYKYYDEPKVYKYQKYEKEIKDLYEIIRQKAMQQPKTQEQEWQEQLEHMDEAVIEQFLRRKKLERIRKVAQ